MKGSDICMPVYFRVLKALTNKMQLPGKNNTLSLVSTSKARARAGAGRAGLVRLGKEEKYES